MNNCGNLSSNLTALALDSLGLLLPAVTGLGVAYRAGKMFGWASKIGRWADDFKILRKTGTWGGTLRRIARNLGEGEVLLLRTRSVAAGVWEEFWRLTGWIRPKPSLTKANELAKWRWGPLDTGLRRMQEILEDSTLGKKFLAHSDNDLQAIFRNGVPLIDNVEIRKVLEKLGDAFQHPDVLTGLLNKAKGADVGDLMRETIRLDANGNIEVFRSAYDVVYKTMPSEGWKAFTDLLAGFTPKKWMR